MDRDNFDSPTYTNQLLRARELLKTQGPAALDNPHAMIGLQCRLPSMLLLRCIGSIARIQMELAA